MNFEDDFKGKVVMVTGAAGGLGKAAAVGFAAAGASVAVTDVKSELGERTVGEIRDLRGQAAFYRLDVTDEAMVGQTVQQITDTFGPIDILVNSAGISGKGFRGFSRIDMTEWDRVYNVNVKGTVHCCKAVSGIFRQRRQGKIVNVASVAGRMPTPGLTHYAASKAAVINFTQTLAAELAGCNVNVNAVCPGWIWTPIYNESEDLEALAQKMDKSPREVFLDMVDEFCCLKREQTEEDIANAILFLASEGARNITGQSVNVDGGAVMC